MAEPVNSRRRYHSPRRTEQAAATRRVILETAQRLFERDGYGATSMAAIASEANVSLKTVYVTFATKSGLLRALWHVLLRGDDEPLPVGERPWFRAVLEEPDPERQLRLNVLNAKMVRRRIGPLLQVVRRAAAADPEVDELWNRIQAEFYDNQRSIIEILHKKNALRPASMPPAPRTSSGRSTTRTCIGFSSVSGDGHPTSTKRGWRTSCANRS